MEQFSEEQINEWKTQSRIKNIIARLNSLSQDFTQYSLGAVFEDIEARKLEFQALHNELRKLLGKEPREYNNGGIT